MQEQDYTEAFLRLFTEIRDELRAIADDLRDLNHSRGKMEEAER